MTYKFENLKEFLLRPINCDENVIVEILDSQSDSDFVEIEALDKDFKKLIVDKSSNKIVISAHIFARLVGLKILVSARALESIFVSGSAQLNCSKTAKDCKINFAGSVSATFMLQQVDSLKFSLAGSAKLSLDASVNNIDISTAGSSKVFLKGQGKQAEFKTCGSSTVSAERFVCNKIEINSSGSNKFVVFAIEQLSISIAGSGKIEYFGSPEITKCRSSGAVTIKKLNLEN